MNMRKIAAKIILLALLALTAAALVSGLFGDAKDENGRYWTDEHRWITFGEYDGKPLIWRILETYKTDKGVTMALLFADEPVANMKFDGDSNDWDSSDIKKWLNDYYAAFNKEERGAILTSTYRYGGEYEGSGKTVASKVFLLSVCEAKDNRYFANDTDRATGSVWWLRSPGNDYDIAASVLSDGELFGTLVNNERGVRPALKINLASSIFKSSASATKYEILYGTRIKVRDTDARPIQGAAVAADNPKQKCFTGNDGAVEMKLGAGKQMIRISAEGYKLHETILTDVKRGGYVVTLEPL
jgi:hypothetical protein